MISFSCKSIVFTSQSPSYGFSWSMLFFEKEHCMTFYELIWRNKSRILFLVSKTLVESKSMHEMHACTICTYIVVFIFPFLVHSPNAKSFEPWIETRSAFAILHLLALFFFVEIASVCLLFFGNKSDLIPSILLPFIRLNHCDSLEQNHSLVSFWFSNIRQILTF